LSSEQVVENLRNVFPSLFNAKPKGQLRESHGAKAVESGMYLEFETPDM
jgi:hypothetical protein